MRVTEVKEYMRFLIWDSLFLYTSSILGSSYKHASLFVWICQIGPSSACCFQWCASILTLFRDVLWVFESLFMLGHVRPQSIVHKVFCRTLIWHVPPTTSTILSAMLGCLVCLGQNLCLESCLPFLVNYPAQYMELVKLYIASAAHYTSRKHGTRWVWQQFSCSLGQFLCSHTLLCSLSKVE